jgi:cation diffusion facilitator family transporter
MDLPPSIPVSSEVSTKRTPLPASAVVTSLGSTERYNDFSAPQGFLGQPASGQSSVYHFALNAILWAFGLNLLIAGIKLFVAAHITHSSALFAEGLHSAADAFNSCSLLIGVTQGNRPPDRSHPFGYGLETNLWALLSTVIMFLSALYSLWMGVDRLLHPVASEQAIWSVIILSVSVILEIVAVLTASRAVLEELDIKTRHPLETFLTAWRCISQIQSPTTRFVFYEDTLALVGALVALVAVQGTEWALHFGVLSKTYAHVPDALASIIIAFLLLSLSIKLFGYNRNHLTGAAAPEKTEKRIREIVAQLHEVTRITELRTIDQGLSGLIVHLVLEVDPDIPIKEVDDVAERVKNNIQREFPNTLQVFVEVLANETEDQWQEQFEKLIQAAEQSQILKPREGQMLRNIEEFTHSVASDIMIPRTDVTMIEQDRDLLEALDLMLQTQHSRLPVYGKQIDDLVGVLHIHDVIAAIRNSEGQLASFTHVLREIDIYPENKPISDLLEEFKRNKIQMAAIADEHGGFVGLVTIEDLLEEIVGELWDEHDTPEESLQLIAPETLLVPGKFDIWDLNERYALNIPEEAFKTVGGFVFGMLGREPEVGDRVVFEDLIFDVTQCEGVRIAEVSIQRPGHPFQGTSVIGDRLG